MNAVEMALVQVDKMESLSQMENRHHQAAEIMQDELSFLLEEKKKKMTMNLQKSMPYWRS